MEHGKKFGLHLVGTQRYQVVRYGPPFSVLEIRNKSRERLSRAFQLEAHKEHDKSFQHKKCEKASSEPLTPEATYFSTCIQKTFKSTFTVVYEFYYTGLL